MMIDMLLSNIGELVCVSPSGRRLYGNEMQDPAILRNSALALDQGKIIAIGPSEVLVSTYKARLEIDCKGKVITPGFIDPHTHPIFVHTRENEFEQRLQGLSYVEISRSGGGIRSTLNTTRNASLRTLTELAAKRLEKMLQQGTTTVEAKSGYGLTTESELTQLEAINLLNQILPLDVIPTFMGAHEFPEEFCENHSGYLKNLCEEMLPAVKKQGIAQFCDIFTEAHVYNLEESRIVLSRAAQLGFKLKMHADEIEPMGAAELAAELGCVSADHLGRISKNGIRALRQNHVIPVLLPATLFSLGCHEYAPARQMIETGLPVALATDFNPGSCNCDSIPLVMSLACLQMQMTPAEALAAVTINAAAALNLDDLLGSVTVGKQADLLIWDIPSYKYIPYHLGSSEPETVIKNGRVITFPLSED